MSKFIQNMRIKYVINMIPIILISLFYYTHYIEGSYSFFIPLGLTFLWLLNSLTITNISNILLNKESKWWLAYAFIAFVMVIIGFSSTNLNFFISRLPYYLIPPMGYFVVKKYSASEMKVLLFFIATIFLSNLIYNISLWTILPDIFEEQESTDMSIQYGIMMNLASTSFIAVCMWLIGCCYMILENIQGKIVKLFILAIIAMTGFYMLFVNVRGTATLLLFVEILALMMAKFEPKTGNRKTYYILNAIIIVFVGSLVVIPLLMWLVQNLDSARLTERLEDVMSFTQTKGNVDSLSEGSMSQRIALAQTSMRSFFSSPISILIGIGDHTVENGMDLHKSGVGNHSEFIDVLARYGLLGAWIFVKIIKTYFANLKTLTNNRNIIKYINVVFFVFILYGFLNNVFQPIMQIFIFIVMPIIIVLTNNKVLSYGR